MKILAITVTIAALCGITAAQSPVPPCQASGNYMVCANGVFALVQRHDNADWTRSQSNPYQQAQEQQARDRELIREKQEELRRIQDQQWHSQSMPVQQCIPDAWGSCPAR
jgi:hypothetical protein